MLQSALNQDHKNIITEFYTAFQEMDAEKMASFYHLHAKFRDPAFGELNSIRIGNMWRMLIDSQKGKDFKVRFGNVTDHSADWEAEYTFTQTGRGVHNHIMARFEFQDGKILLHEDYFDLHNWAKQALGFKGWLFGGSRTFQNKLQSRTNIMIQKYEASLHE